MRRLAAIFASFVASSLCYASNWAAIANGDGFTLKLDVSSVRDDSGITKAWFWWVHDRPQKAPNTALYMSQKAMWHFNCAQREAAPAVAVYYREADAVEPIFRESVQSTDFEPVVPDSIGDTMISFVCPVRSMKK